jgi:membrane protein DedA with SNARE-associated domain
MFRDPCRTDHRRPVRFDSGPFRGSVGRREPENGGVGRHRKAARQKTFFSFGVLEHFVSTYGFWAILIGTFFEGEMILVMGGFAAYQGYLGFPPVVLAAFLGSYSGDQLFFFLGRRHSGRILKLFPSWGKRMAVINRWLERIGTPVILLFRFTYGFRTITPFVLGMSSVRSRTFVILNGLGALAWALLVAAGGYFFGFTLEKALGDIRHYERLVFGAILAAGLAAWAFHFFRSRGTGARGNGT